VAIDFRAPRTEELRLPFGLAWISAIPARLVLTGIVGASFLIRFVVALAHATPLYFPTSTSTQRSRGRLRSTAGR
jgi:hypothetical protein